MKITIESTDTKFSLALIDWLNNQTVEPNSTTIRLHEDDMKADTEYSVEHGELLLFPCTPKSAQWIAKYITTNVADTIHYEIVRGAEVIGQMRLDGLKVKVKEGGYDFPITK